MAYFDRTYRLGFGGGLTKAVKYLLITNIVVYIFQRLIIGPALIDWFALHPALVFTKLQIWQFLTYMFLHSQTDLLHLLFNMFVLWMFGGEVERSLGTREFVKYYLICGVGAGMFHILFSYVLGSDPNVAVVGASGAIYGVMVAFAVLFPDRVITLLLFLFLPVQIKAKYLVMIFGAIALFLGAAGSDDGVAHFAHLGGMAIGFAYLKLDWRLDYLGKWIRQQRESKRALVKLKKQQDKQRFRERVDEILDKINEVGYKNLNAAEKRILQEASEQFSQEKESEN